MLSSRFKSSVPVPTGPVAPAELPPVEGKRLTAISLRPTLETIGPASSPTRISCFWEASIGELLWARYCDATSWTYTPPPFAHTVSPSYISGGGLGVFASDDIKPGDVVMEERPLLVTFGFTPEKRDRDLEERILGAMSEEGRRAFLSLGNVFEKTEGRVFGRVLTNGIGIGELEGSTTNAGYVAVAEHIARVNHSCRPSTSWRFDATTFTIQLRALCHIPSGSEITTSYIDLLLPSSTRQSELRRKYGFSCSCPACSLPVGSKELKFSDMSRGLLRTWAKNNDYDVHEKELANWITRRSSMQAEKRVVEDKKFVDRYLSMAKTLEREHVWPADVWTRVIQPLVKVYCVMEDRDNAVLWAKRAGELTMVAQGTDGGWKSVADSPERTEWWGLRGARQLG